ncbi:MAG: blc, partial [Caulobacteraceae bacterium]|nr:blc [Caulobacteraceae bacterium]
MLKRILLAAALALGIASAAQATPEPHQRIELAQMMGRWYEVARIPNKLQNGCVSGTSDWTANAAGFAFVQACRKGSELA